MSPIRRSRKGISKTRGVRPIPHRRRISFRSTRSHLKFGTLQTATLTFGAWCEFLGQVKENRQKVARAAAMWTGGLLLRCFLGFDRYRKQRILHRERNELAAYTAAAERRR